MILCRVVLNQLAKCGKDSHFVSSTVVLILEIGSTFDHSM